MPQKKSIYKSTKSVVTQDRTNGSKPTEYRFLNVVVTHGVIQPEEYCSNHVLPDIHFLNMKFGWTKYNGNVIADITFELFVPIRITAYIFY